MSINYKKFLFTVFAPSSLINPSKSAIHPHLNLFSRPRNVRGNAHDTARTSPDEIKLEGKYSGSRPVLLNVPQDSEIE